MKHLTCKASITNGLRQSTVCLSSAFFVDALGSLTCASCKTVWKLEDLKNAKFPISKEC